MSEGSALDFIAEYIDTKKQSIGKEIDSLTTLSKQSSSKKISDFISTEAAEKAWEKIKDGPLGQMGKDFVSEQIAKNGSKLINNLDTAIKKKVAKPLAELQAAVFDTMTAALTAKNDLGMYFIQQVAKELVIQIDKKRAATTQLQTKIRELYNILILLTTTKPFFDKYLADLRKALTMIYESRNELVLVRNTLFKTDRWQKTRFKQVQDRLIAADALLSPAPQKVDIKYNGGGLLSGVGIPKQPQQLMLILSVPQKIKEVLACANGYFILTLKVNAMLLAFCAAYGSFTAASSSKLKSMTIGTLDNIVAKLDDLISRMATQLNGSSSSILEPDIVRVTNLDPTFMAAVSDGTAPQDAIGMFPPTQTTKRYAPDPVLTSANAMSWIFEVKTIIEYLKFVPGPTLAALDVSNNALNLYNEAVATIQSKGNRVDGAAILTATEGREETGQLEKQVSTFLLQAAKAVYDPATGKIILPLGRTLLKRLDLSLQQDLEIRDAVNKFANAQLSFPSAIGKAGSAISKMLSKFGLDRAANALRTGDFAKLFNMNGKTATYVGAAITAISVLKECLNTTEDREQLTQAKREMERDQTSKELLMQRQSATGFQQQITQIEVEEVKLDTLSMRAKKAGSKCGLPNDLAPANLIKNIGPIVGVSVLGNKTLQASVTKLGKGII